MGIRKLGRRSLWPGTGNRESRSSGWGWGWGGGGEEGLERVAAFQ